MHDDSPTCLPPSTVVVVGLGKIGLPLAVQYARHGWRVLGCDINPQVVEAINAGQSPIQQEPELSSELSSVVSKGLLVATVDTTEAVHRAEVVVVIVPVAINAQQKVNFEAIDSATVAIAAGLRPNTLVIYETTLPVGTTTQRFGQIFEQVANLKAGPDFSLAYSPERVSCGRIFHDLHTYPKVVGGIDERSTASAAAFYRSVLEVQVITMASTDEAEFVKLIETVYRDVNIALANEYACYADMHRLDVVAAIRAANTQPYSHIHTPGVGVGGHCIPVYPYFLLGSDLSSTPSEVQVFYGQVSEGEQVSPCMVGAHPCDRPLRGQQMLALVHAARRVNDGMAEYAVRRIEAAVGPLASRSILILGVAYRGNVRETAFSSAELLEQAFLKRGARVYVDDPLWSSDELSALGYTPLTSKLESEIEVIVLQADHAAYQVLDFRRFAACQVVLDGRRALCRETIESLGMRYIAIGDGGLSSTTPTPLAMSAPLRCGVGRRSVLMAKVLFISPNYLPENGAAAVCVSETAKRLVERGHQVTVLTTVPNYPSGIVPPEYRGRVLQEEVRDGVRVVRVWSYTSPNKGFLRRILSHFSFGCLAPLLGGKAVGRPDVIIVQLAPLFNTIAARLLAWWKYCPFICMVSDLWPESAVQFGVLRNRLCIKLAEWLEWSTYRHAGFVWAMSQGSYEWLMRRGLAAERMFLLTNGVDTTRFRPLSQAQAREKLGWDERFTVLYAGNHGLAYDLQTLLDAAEQMQAETDVHFVFAGDGVKKAELMAQAEERDLQNVSFLGSLPHECIPLLIASADVCPIPLRKLPWVEMALPIKMLEAMACARPVLLACEGGLRRLMEEADAGIYVEPENAASLVSAIRYLREHPEVAASLGQHGRALVEARFDYHQLTTMLDAQIARLVGTRFITSLSPDGVPVGTGTQREVYHAHESGTR